MSRDSQSQAWVRFWTCTEGIIDTDSVETCQKDMVDAISALTSMRLPIDAIEQLVNVVHAAYEIGKLRNDK
jgi:hypothetical protein